jgi:hypothetical protein
MGYYSAAKPLNELLAEVQRRLPPDQRALQEAFSTDHRRPVMVPIARLAPTTFYYFDDITAHAFSEAVVELAGMRAGGRLTVSYPFNGEFRAQQHRLQRLAPKLERIRVLAVDAPRKMSGLAGGVNHHNISHTPLARFRLAVKEDAQPVLFICRETRQSPFADGPRSLGFFTADPEVVEEITEDIDQTLHGLSTTLVAFQRLELLHRTTQRVTRELESYSRRMEIAIQRARRRPDLLTPERLERILGQAAAKMRELEEIPRRAMRAIDRSQR